MPIFSNQGGGVFAPQNPNPSGTTTIVKNLAGSFAIRESVAKPLAASYRVLTQVVASLSGHFSLNGSDPNVLPFTPSLARTVTIHPDSNTRPFTAGAFWNMGSPKKPKGVKDPDSVIDITFDWTQWLDDAGDEIAPDGLSFTLADGMTEVGKWLVDGARCTVLFSGGVKPNLAAVTCRIETTSTPPRIDEKTVYLKIEE